MYVIPVDQGKRLESAESLLKFPVRRCHDRVRQTATSASHPHEHGLIRLQGLGLLYQRLLRCQDDGLDTNITLEPPAQHGQSLKGLSHWIIQIGFQETQRSHIILNPLTMAVEGIERAQYNGVDITPPWQVTDNRPCLTWGHGIPFYLQFGIRREAF